MAHLFAFRESENHITVIDEKYNITSTSYNYDHASGDFGNMRKLTPKERWDIKSILEMEAIEYKDDVFKIPVKTIKQGTRTKCTKINIYDLTNDGKNVKVVNSYPLVPPASIKEKYPNFDGYWRAVFYKERHY